MILVTGGTGLVGSHLLYELVKKEDAVRAIYRNRSSIDLAKKVFALFDKTDTLFGKVEWIQADINDIPSLTKAFKGVKSVYHAAALVSFDPSDYKKLRKINIEGTANVVNLCIENSVEKLCYVSSIATLGKTVDGSPITEDTHWNPDANNNVYAITKYGAEMEVWRSTQERLKAVIVNPGVILGPPFIESGSGAIYKAIKKGLKFYPPGGTGIINVKEVVNAMIKLMESNVKNERFILVDKNLTYKELFVNMANDLGLKAPKTGLKPWQLQVLWRLDWLRTSLFGGKRKLTKYTASSVAKRDFYSNGKISQLN